MKNLYIKFSKNTFVLNFMKIRPVGTKVCNADERMDKQT